MLSAAVLAEMTPVFVVMQTHPNKSRGFPSKAACWILLALVAVSLRAQTAKELSQVRKVFVVPLSGDDSSATLRESLVKRLRKNGKFEVVATSGQADAVVRVSGQIWVSGYEVANPRSPANRHAVYAGFLSVEMVGADNALLWSHLVIPGNFSFGRVSDSLSKTLVKALVDAQVKSAQLPKQVVAETSLQGAGSTLAAPIYQEWIESFQRQHPQVRVRYDAVGSALGTQLLLEQKVDFAASEVPPSNQGPSQSTAPPRQLASLLGAVVPIYNLKARRQQLRFTPEALAGIYLGKITKWNDPIIQGANKDVTLPDADIVVIHRSDGSGTTYAWSDYLSKISNDWRTEVGAGATLHWPIGTGADGNEGVAATVERTPNSVGYVELFYAVRHRLYFGSVRNAAGVFTQANLDSVGAAAGSAMTENSGTPFSITDASGKEAYPIATFTFFLLPQQISDIRKKAVLIDFFRWVLTSGQRECSALGYAPLPHDFAVRQLRVLNSLN
jgi:phosphate transport system substrate-binding protein